MRHRQTLASLCVLMTALLCMQTPVLGHENRAALDDPRPQVTANPIHAIGRLDIGQTGFCTATLIGDSLILTAAHCLFDEDSMEPVDPSDLLFRAGLRDGTEQARRHVQRMVLHPDYRHTGDPTHEAVAADLALLQLDQPLVGDRVLPLPINGGIQIGDSVNMVSYARLREEAPRIQDDCSIIDRGTAILMLTCDVDFGASGAPVFQGGDRGWHVTSVVSAMTEFEGERVALAAAVEAGLSPMLVEMAEAIRRDPGPTSIGAPSAIPQTD